MIGLAPGASRIVQPLFARGLGFPLFDVPVAFGVPAPVGAAAPSTRAALATPRLDPNAREAVRKAAVDAMNGIAAAWLKDARTKDQDNLLVPSNLSKDDALLVQMRARNAFYSAYRSRIDANVNAVRGEYFAAGAYAVDPLPADAQRAYEALSDPSNYADSWGSTWSSVGHVLNAWGPKTVQAGFGKGEATRETERLANFTGDLGLADAAAEWEAAIASYGHSGAPYSAKYAESARGGPTVEDAFPWFADAKKWAKFAGTAAVIGIALMALNVVLPRS